MKYLLIALLLITPVVMADLAEMDRQLEEMRSYRYEQMRQQQQQQQNESDNYRQQQNNIVQQRQSQIASPPVPKPIPYNETTLH